MTADHLRWITPTSGEPFAIIHDYTLINATDHVAIYQQIDGDEVRIATATSVEQAIQIISEHDATTG